MPHILVTGAFGQIGTELTQALRAAHGADEVLATGRRLPGDAARQGPVAVLDVTDAAAVEETISRYRIDRVFHLAARLSAVAEQAPLPVWQVNVDGLRNVLEACRRQQVAQVFWPSSIAVFGPETPRDNTPQETILRPTTMYGVTKVAGELLCDYYVRRFGVDVRGVRYPGIISSETLPGGGTTDYAVAIYYEAIAHKHYTCFVSADTVLPMMYMPDCIKGTIDLMEADAGRLEHHADFNMAAMSFSAGELAAEIKKHIPEFECAYEPDSRQAIADSWPRSLDDSAARKEWGWQPTYDLATMTADMLEKLGKRHAEGRLYPGDEVACD